MKGALKVTAGLLAVSAKVQIRAFLKVASKQDIFAKNRELYEELGKILNMDIGPYTSCSEGTPSQVRELYNGFDPKIYQHV